MLVSSIVFLHGQALLRSAAGVDWHERACDRSRVVGELPVPLRAAASALAASSSTSLDVELSYGHNVKYFHSNCAGRCPASAAEGVGSAIGAVLSDACRSFGGPA
jgi:hypothetical protein